MTNSPWAILSTPSRPKITASPSASTASVETPYSTLIAWVTISGSITTPLSPVTFPGRSAAQSDALQTRDRNRRRVYNDPGSAVHRFALHRVRENGPTGIHFQAMHYALHSSPLFTSAKVLMISNSVPLQVA